MRIARSGAALVALLALTAAGSAWPAAATESPGPEGIAKAYLEAFYGHDYRRVYNLLSAADRRVKTEGEYISERGDPRDPPAAAFLGEVAGRLAKAIRYRKSEVKVEGDRSRVILQAVMPDGQAVFDRLFGDRDPSKLSSRERARARQQLERILRTEEIPTVEGEEEVTLVREEGRWRVILNWASAIPVHLVAMTAPDLPWTFRPERPLVRAMPGETIETAYVVKNRSDTPVTAKALHLVAPEDKAEYLNVIQCFCLIQQTLIPGQEMRLPVLFQVASDLPAGVTGFALVYKFYPVAHFPSPGTPARDEASREMTQAAQRAMGGEPGAAVRTPPLASAER